MNNSMDGKAFEELIEKFLVPKLWMEAVVDRNNWPLDKIAALAPMIQAVGASIINLSPYSPDFNPLNYGGRNLSLFRLTILQMQQKYFIH